ncbi:hypothetical protein AVEN_187508-1 [Araneus ventricosus]|uniref:Endonuclease/exonuclease/phosphatase domain-containing protein n=1 Tax=Araneus ventricosus TaxID=182803 RepID=A0A4Y2BS23_ARAVE|nr:hypothetical protein AVEN_187508-1 [Araneus ventricosus]
MALEDGRLKNVRGLRTKTVEFFSSVEYDVICVTETWLCEGIDSWHLFDDRYLVYRKDRGSSSNSSRRGGGVLVAIKRCLSSRKLDVPGLDLEAIWISVKLNHSKKMFLCVVHFPPSSHVDTYVKFFYCFEGFEFFDKILICGDFNLSIYDDFCDHNDPIVSELSNFMNIFNLGQYNNILNCNNKYLDLILTNVDFNDISVGHSDSPLVPEDKHHPALSVSMGFVPVHLNNRNVYL